MNTRTACLTFYIFLISITVWGQKQEGNVSETRVNLQREIKLERNSESEEVILNIEEGVDRFELIINSSVTAGVVKIEVADPKGDNQGAFSVGTQLNAKKMERVNGNINKSLKDPQSGNWKVRIIPTEATGTISIQTGLIY